MGVLYRIVLPSDVPDQIRSAATRAIEEAAADFGFYPGRVSIEWVTRGSPRAQSTPTPPQSGVTERVPSADDSDGASGWSAGSGRRVAILDGDAHPLDPERYREPDDEPWGWIQQMFPTTVFLRTDIPARQLTTIVRREVCHLGQVKRHGWPLTEADEREAAARA